MKKDFQKERQSFTFYLSFHKAIKSLKSRERLLIYDTIVEYALLGKEPVNLSPMSQLVWDLIEPTLSKSRINFLNGCKTPHPNRTTSETTTENPISLPSDQPSNPTSQTASTDTDTNTDTNTDTKNMDTIAKIIRSASPNKSAKALIDEYLAKIRSDVMRKAIGEWFEYKLERGEAYRSLKGMQRFCIKLKELSDGNEYRAQQILSNSMVNNWSGIFPLKDDYVPIKQRGEGYMRGYA
ncbi:MAG: hypothetical protein J6L01_00865 [Alistipes sp.]|nr:hypothetical protein [Alistipes sp.]